jgi:tetratricopeptide (TPR) repeat protein
MFDVRQYWDYGDPASSQQRFEQLLSLLNTPEGQQKFGLESQDIQEALLEVKAQIARTYSLRQDFDSAHQILDEIKGDPDLRDRALAAYCLERGRTYNSAGDQHQARPFFDQAILVGEDDQKVDALHMNAILESGPEALTLNEQALEVARLSPDPRAQAWRGSLLNNLGWTYFDLMQYEKALEIFGEAVEFRQAQGHPTQLHIAWYSVARTLRAMDRHPEALEILMDLEEGDGYVHEEIAENLFATGQIAESESEFAKAFALLSLDGWLAKTEPDRLERIQRLSQ